MGMLLNFLRGIGMQETHQEAEPVQGYTAGRAIEEKPEYLIHIRAAIPGESYPRLVISRIRDGKKAEISLYNESIWPLIQIGIANRE